MRVKGVVVRGLGEGSFYVKLYSEEIKKVLGKDPFPGTINLKVTKAEYLKVKELARKVIRGKNLGKKRIYDAYYVRCSLKGKEGIVVFPTKGGHFGILEVILGERVEIKEGEEIEVEIKDAKAPSPFPSSTS